MPGPIIQISMDAADPAALGGFWVEVLGYVEQPPPEGYASWNEFLDSIGVPEEQRDLAYAIVDPEGKRPRIYMQKVPEAKSAKNRLHLDVTVSRQDMDVGTRKAIVESEVERVVGLGAARQETFDRDDEYWVVLTDPEGNEFCIQ